MDFQFTISEISQTFSAIASSSFFGVIKILLSIYVIVILIDIILILVLRSSGSDFRTILKGANLPSVGKGKMTKRWEKITNKLESGNVSQYKLAVLEADKFANEILTGIGYTGGNMKEKLESVKPGQLDNAEELMRVHEIRNKIIHDKNFQVDKNLAREIIETYEEFLKSLEFIS